MSEKMKVDLNGKVAIVTGGAGVIGKAIAGALMQNGAKVILADISMPSLEAACAELREGGGEVTPAICDVSSKEQCAALVETAVKTYGGLDILCNNAGINVGSKDRVNFWEYNDAMFEKIIGIDLMGVYYLSKPAAKYMVEHGGGSIVNTASVNGIVPLRYQIAYNAAKAAVISMTRSMAVELGGTGVRVNALAPGSTLNPQLQEVFYSDKERSAAMLSHIPMHRTADPYEQAAMVLFLVSDDASYVTGTTGVVDGGWVSGYTRDF